MTQQDKQTVIDALEYALNDCPVKDGDHQTHFNTFANAIEIVKNWPIPNDVESAELVANDEQGTPIVDEYGTMTCNCVEPRQSHFPNGKWICTKCWGEWYH